MLTLWGMLSPLVERLRPAKPVAAKPVAPKRPRDSKRGKPESGVEESALFVPVKVPRERAKRRITPEKETVGRTSEALTAVEKPGRTSRVPATKRVPMQERYDALVKEMLQTYGVRVRKWRTSMSGVAWYVEYRDGSVVRLLESPKPKSPMSLAIFLHEIGHHAIGLGIYKPRCLEEYLAWNYAVQKMEERGFEVTDRVKRRMHRSLKYAVGKAVRRGLRVLPPELEPYR